MRLHRVRACVLLASLCALPLSGAEAEANPLGAAGQRVPFGDIALELVLGAGAAGTGDEIAPDFSLRVSPGLMYFFAPNLAWGVSLDARYADYELQAFPYSELDLGVSVGFGVHLPLNESIGFFPRIWLGGGYWRREYDELRIGEMPFFDPAFAPFGLTWIIEGPYLSTQLLLPLAVNIAQATFISIGPHARLHWALKDGSNSLDFGIAAGVGRYF